MVDAKSLYDSVANALGAMAGEYSTVKLYLSPDGYGRWKREPVTEGIGIDSPLTVTDIQATPQLEGESFEVFPTEIDALDGTYSCFPLDYGITWIRQNVCRYDDPQEGGVRFTVQMKFEIESRQFVPNEEVYERSGVFVDAEPHIVVPVDELSREVLTLVFHRRIAARESLYTHDHDQEVSTDRVLQDMAVSISEQCGSLYTEPVEVQERYAEVDPEVDLDPGAPPEWEVKEREVEAGEYVYQLGGVCFRRTG